MSKLPGPRHPADQKSPSDGSKPSAADAKKRGMEELTFDQMKELEESRHKEEDARLLAECEKIRQIREQEELQGKPKKVVEKILLGEGPIVHEEKKSGLPDRIRKLPKDHPERILFEKGFLARSHKNWKKAAPPGSRSRSNASSRSFSALLIFELMVFVVAVGGLYYGVLRYVAKVDTTRTEISKVIKQKHYPPDHPKVVESFTGLSETNWLPTLMRLLGVANSLEFNYETLEDNPEGGTYLEHIRRHNIPFNEGDAMIWRTREVRKPPWAKGGTGQPR